MAMSQEQAVKVQNKLQEEYKTYQALEKRKQALMGPRQSFMAQVEENSMVLDELERLDGTDTIYKMVGPVLMKQDSDEAVSTVKNRLDWLKKRLDASEAEGVAIDKDLENSKKTIVGLQQIMQRAVQAMQQQMQQQVQQQAQAAGGAKKK